MSYLSKKRFRQGVGVGLDDLAANKMEAASFYTELLMSNGYIGYFDIEDIGMRVFVFKDYDSTEAFMKEVRKINLRTLGRIADFIYISNSELERPHLKHHRGQKSYYSELYK